MFALYAIGQHRFIENNNQWPEQVHFGSDISGGKVYLQEDGLLVDLYDTDVVNQVFAAHGGGTPTQKPEFLKCHSYKVRLVDGNMEVARGSKPLKGVHNYFLGNDKSKWASGARAFQSVLYPEVYSGIDLKVHSNGNLKYDFIIKPNGDPDQITLEYEGVKPRVNSKGELILETTVGTVTEKKPFAYQYVDGSLEAVNCTYRLKGGVLSFKLGEYRPNYDLIIDPELIFSSYSGSFANNFGYTATYDDDGHLYSGSSAFGDGYPVTIGAYQTEWAGGGSEVGTGTDVVISKFSLDGTSLIYSTYIGGSEDDLPHSLITDDSNKLYIMGTTGSDDFPVTDGAFQSDFLGGDTINVSGLGISYLNGCDLFISTLSVEGTELSASTYVGGSENDGFNTPAALKYNYADEVRGEIELDGDNNIIFGSCSFSDDFPVLTNAYQTEKGTGQDGVIVKLSNDLSSLLGSSFFGGDGADAIYSIHYSSDGTILAGGGTTSENLPASDNAFQQNYGGGRSDGFVLRLDENLEVNQRMTYYGTEFYDQVYFIERDQFGIPYLLGQTESGDELIENAQYATTGGGMLIAKLEPDLGDRIWSTLFGTPDSIPNISPTAFAVDICNSIYLSGWGSTILFGDSLDITDDALQFTTDGNDFYFMVLSDDADELTFATYFGGNQSAEHVDGGTSRFDRSGQIYQAVCAGCQGNNDFPTFPSNVVSTTNNSNDLCNLGVAKIDLDLPLILADFENDEVCLPDSTQFSSTSEIYTGSNPIYHWIFEDGEESFEENPQHQFSGPGTYEVMLILSDPQSCNLVDTIRREVQVFPSLTLEVPDQVVSCVQDTLSITAETNGTANFFQWSTDSGFNNILLEGNTASTLVYAPGELTSIYVFVSNGLCDEVREILLAPMPIAELSIPDSVFCNTPEVEVSLEVTNGYELDGLLWTPEELVLEGQGTATSTLSIGNPADFSVVGTTQFDCEVDLQVNLANYDIGLEASTDTLTCKNIPINIGATSFGSAETFTWSTDPNFSNILNPSGDSIITVTPTSVMFYYVMADNNGCSLVDSVAVSLLSAGTTITSDRYICAGDTATIIVSNDFPGSNLSHIWEPDELILSGQGTPIIRAIVTEPTTFSVTSSTEQGCEVNNSSTVFVSDLGNLDINASASPQNINPGTSSELQALPAIEDYIYQWNPPDFLNINFGPSPISTPPATTTYVVTVTDTGENGFCAKSDSVTIFVFESVCGEPNIFVPNTFTPNGDGENEELLVRGNNITDLKFSVFNRWGEKVFETSDQNIGWDGTYKGELANPAVFVYQLEVVCGDGQEYFTKGNVTLIR